ncbi:YhbY family RNA-binding protein, partial [Burkholderia mallei]
MPALSLSPAERSALRSEAHALKPVVLIGAEGLTDAVLAEIEVHLAAHQLIK